MASEPHDGLWQQRPQERYALTVEPLVGSLVALARRILRSDDLAWDAVQEALLSLWLEGTLPPNPRAWLIRTVIHRSLHMARTNQRRRKHEERAGRQRPATSRRDEPMHRLESDELQQSFQDALAQLTPEARDILILRIISRMDYAAIAASLQIPQGTVRSRLSRSRQELRRILLRRMPDVLGGVSGRTFSPRIEPTSRSLPGARNDSKTN